jgi:hypothetical protein
MNQILINVPQARVIYNYLYDDMPIDWREEDLFLAELPNGDYLDVGWYPACDPDGRFRIALRHSINGAPIGAIRVVNPAHIADAAETLAFTDVRTSAQAKPCANLQRTVPYDPASIFAAVA